MREKLARGRKAGGGGRSWRDRWGLGKRQNGELLEREKYGGVVEVGGVPGKDRVDEGEVGRAPGKGRVDEALGEMLLGSDQFSEWGSNLGLIKRAHRGSLS